MSFLAMPAYLLAADSTRRFSAWDGLWIAVWLAAFTLESTADLQKRRHFCPLGFRASFSPSPRKLKATVTTARTAAGASSRWG